VSVADHTSNAPLRVVTSTAELASSPASGTRAVVMTMGALHEGHLSLVRLARELADEVVVTIFVNPLQFNDPGDLERYPRTLAADCALLEPLGVDLVFAPDAVEVYQRDPVVTVSAGHLGTMLEGEYRPGHFDGVLTVVLKLMNLTRPDVAVFGAKDAQQVIAITSMVRDLNVPTRIAVGPTLREASGLAMSSRNTQLSDLERQQALALSAALRASEAAAQAGHTLTEVVDAGRAVLDAAVGVDAQYYTAMDPESGAELGADDTGPAVIVVAAYVGRTRLIDNVAVSIKE
jgi:pantoate--beta-alanine ligase